MCVVDVVLVCPLLGGVRTESPPPPLANENLEPDGLEYFDGEGEIKVSPPPPLLNENLDLDGDVKDCAVPGVDACGVGFGTLSSVAADAGVLVPIVSVAV